MPTVRPFNSSPFTTPITTEKTGSGPSRRPVVSRRSTTEAPPPVVTSPSGQFPVSTRKSDIDYDIEGK